jgi:methionyl-tRNA formyltransferase
VLTQPDRPAGRGLQPQPSAVKRFALARGIPVLQPDTLKDSRDVERVRQLRPDALVVAAYGMILPRPLLDAGRLGALNIHASLLPRWRGAAPIQRAILAGDSETGVSIMQMDAGLDTGPVFGTVTEPIHPTDTAGDLLERARSTLGSSAVIEFNHDLLASLTCTICEETEPLFLSLGKVTEKIGQCPTCGEPRTPNLYHTLGNDSDMLDRTLGELGVPLWDIVSVRSVM